MKAQFLDCYLGDELTFPGLVYVKPRNAVTHKPDNVYIQLQAKQRERTNFLFISL
jgi:hypothetical protein